MMPQVPSISGHRAEADGRAAQIVFKGYFLAVAVGGENGVGRLPSSLAAESGSKLSRRIADRVEIQRLTDHAGGGDDHIIRCNSHGFCGNPAHFPRLFLAVGVAGVGVAAVADNALGVSVGDILPCDGDGSAFDEILGVSSRGGAADVAPHHGEVALGFVASHTAVDAGSLKAERRGNSAGNDAGMGQSEQKF